METASEENSETMIDVANEMEPWTFFFNREDKRWVVHAAYETYSNVCAYDGAYSAYGEAVDVAIQEIKKEFALQVEMRSEYATRLSEMQDWGKRQTGET